MVSPCKLKLSCWIKTSHFELYLNNNDFVGKLYEVENYMYICVYPCCSLCICIIVYVYFMYIVFFISCTCKGGTTYIFVNKLKCNHMNLKGALCDYSCNRTKYTLHVNMLWFFSNILYGSQYDVIKMVDTSIKYKQYNVIKVKNEKI